MISTHTLLAERDTRPIAIETAIWISTHTLLAERDLPESLACLFYQVFLLTRSSRSVTSGAQTRGWILFHFYSHAPRGA